MLVEYNAQKIDDKYIDSLKNGVFKVDYEKINNQFKSYLNVPYFKMLNSGTSSLMLALRALDIPSDRKIIGPSYAHPAWLNASRFLGYDNIEFIDIKKETLSMNPDELKKKVTVHTGVVFFVNKNGYVGEDLLEIREICDYYNVPLIEDACNAFGQKNNGVLAGTIGDIGCYSFGTPKILTCCEGGAVVTKDKKLYNRIDDLSYQGGWYKYNKTGITMGGNFAIPNTSRILLSEQLKDIKELQRKRHELFMTYEDNINSGYMHEYPVDGFIGYPMNILIDGDKDKIEEMSSRLKIELKFGLYKSLGRFFKKRCEISEYIEDNVIFLPVYATEKQARLVCGVT